TVVIAGATQSAVALSPTRTPNLLERSATAIIDAATQTAFARNASQTLNPIQMTLFAEHTATVIALTVFPTSTPELNFPADVLNEVESIEQTWDAEFLTVTALSSTLTNNQMTATSVIREASGTVAARTPTQ